jgi:hypothetical protein
VAKSMTFGMPCKLAVVPVVVVADGAVGTLENNSSVVLVYRSSQFLVV